MEKRVRARVYGIVQGVGFRPFVSRIAAREGIAGSVCNKGPYVEIFAQAALERVDAFLRSLTAEAPERSAILRVETREEPPNGDRAFAIIQSAREKGDIFVSPDIAICPKCKAELFDPKNRRYLHPFINCTACGPRLTILDSMPYDRERTSMGAFPMCPECREEYTDPACRRYHAQPVCCPSCGPCLFIPGTDLKDAAALCKTREVLRQGGIAAVKGIGGFHLCCDAANEQAVSRLRRLKSRPAKPFAVMLRDLETARRECEVLEGQEAVLDGPQKPILLLRRRPGGRVCAVAAPENPYLGVMLPYAPVQLLLFSYPDGEEMTDCFVMTSGNPSGAPICRTDEDVRRDLPGLCDVILSNDRPIRLRADDSVAAWFCGRPYMVRRSRGYAPLPVALPPEPSAPEQPGSEELGAEEPGAGSSGPARVLAVGGELKGTFCLGTGSLLYLSPYIAPLSDVRSVRALGEAAERMERLLELTPQAVACDLHPGYNSTEFAREYAARRGLPILPVQHHYAHIAACMAENGVPGGEEVLGAAFDGTGYGTDGTVWGGEFLRASYSGFERLGSVAPFRQAGGDLAVREGWRVAVSLLLGAFSPEQAREAALRLGLCTEREFGVQRAMLERSVNCVVSTSAGRLFDAASALLGLRRRSTYEGEASCALQYAAEEAGEASADAAPGASPPAPELCEREGRFAVQTAPVFRWLTAGALAGKPRAELAAGFHRAMAETVLAGCRRAREQTGLSTVALSGGVFQNLLLLGLCRDLLAADGFRVLTHTLVPPNDGGIALGQAAVALHRMRAGTLPPAAESN